MSSMYWHTSVVHHLAHDREIQRSEREIPERVPRERSGGED
jgi:hypothetical protein